MENKSNRPIISQHWGNVTLLRSYHAPLYLPDPNGGMYLADTKGGPLMMELECDCGHRWEILQQTYPGRRKLRNCGRPECRFSHPKPPKLQKQHGISTSIYVDFDVFVALSDYARDHHLNFSQATNEVCRKGLVAQLLE